ncbi:neuronal growth regulator 1-like [Scleropages formosus]|uniref:Neuronal growth regulator 1 n=1 Tax=Scleropages formosus TaxID=113540 RepID=A0A0P7W164_SCLFO|nr:neuronal growth regulator 1-like [Scleropages formosus]
MSRCYLSDGLSKGAWLNRSSIIFAGEDKWSVDPRVSIVSGTGSKHEYSLQIQKVDVTDDGQYTCSVQSDHNPQSNHIHLSVKGGGGADLVGSYCVAGVGFESRLERFAVDWRPVRGACAFPPSTLHPVLPGKFSVSGTGEWLVDWRSGSERGSVGEIYDISPDITVNEGSNVSLSCLATGKPEPTISWRHVTPLAKKFDTGEYLTITGITRDQAGDYECSAQNDISFPDTKTVRVTVDCAEDNEAATAARKTGSLLALHSDLGLLRTVI